MRIKFNKFERVAGIFVLTAIIGSIVSTAGIAIEKGWFSSKVEFQTVLESAEGIHAGTVVQIAGLRAGSVKNVELISDNEVLVKFEIFEKFHSRVRKDSEMQVIRPFIIGERVFEIAVGTEDQPIMERGSLIITKKSFDIMDLVSGRKLAPFLGTIEALTENLQILAKAFADEKRTLAFVKLFDQLNPLVTNMNKMAKQVVGVTNVVTRKNRLEKVVQNLVSLTTELNVIVPQLTSESPTIGTQMAQLLGSLAELTNEFKKLTPTINAVAPELPRASQRAIEALDETVVTLKAIQKSFLLRGNVEEVKEEETKRLPASQ